MKLGDNKQQDGMELFVVLIKLEQLYDNLY